MAWVLLGLWTLALLAAAPEATSLWGFNGFRTASYAWPALAIAAAGAWALGRWRPRSTWPWVAVAVALALVLAFPWREKVHVLGDTQLRMRTLFAESLPAAASAWGAWWSRVAHVLHAAPLDIALDVIPVLILHRSGMAVGDAVAGVGCIQALGFMALAWRLACRLAPERDVAGPLALAITLTGLLEAFAGYADSASLLALVAMGWWSEVAAPLERPSQAWRATAWLAALPLCHRVGAVMLLPQLLRAAGPGRPGDRAEVRRTLLMLTLGVTAIAIAATAATPAGRQLAWDATELARSWRSFELAPLDLASVLIVVAPLAFAAPALASSAARGFVLDPRAAWIAIAALPLLALALVFPFGANGLGFHRDWDTNVLLGVTLTVGAAMLLARAGASRLGAALTAALPLLALTALSWVAVNANAALATRRAIALATSPDALTAPQRANLHAYFGQRAMDEGHPEVAAPHYDVAFREGGNPRRALLAAEAWVMAGRPDAARAALAAARATGALSPELERSARQIESSLAPSDRVGTP